MSELKGLWCFYIGQGGRQWSKGASADPRWHTLTHTHFLFLLSLTPPSPFLHTDVHGQTYACTQTCTFLSQIHTAMHEHTLTHTHMPRPCCPIPIPTPLWPFWLLFVSPVCRVTRTFLSRPLGSVQPPGTDQDPMQPSTPDATTC